MSTMLERPERKMVTLREQVLACVEPGGEETERLLALADRVDDGAKDTGWSEMPLATLCEHIVRQHHDYLRAALPRLSNHSVNAADAMKSSPEYRRLAEVFAGFRMDLEAHMAKEESTFFPQIAALEQPASPGGFRASIAGPIGFLVAEHDEAEASLEAMRGLTGGFRPPAEAGAACRVLLAELAILTEDMRWHVHKENAVLFPRAAALEREQTPEVW